MTMHTKTESVPIQRQPIYLELPWPPRELSPNVRLHWARLAKAKAKFRRSCFLHTLIVPPKLREVPPGRLRLVLTFHAPNKRRRDRDNLLASMKAGIDGMCEALCIDDARFAEVLVRIADDVAQEPRVGVRIEAVTP